MQSYLVTTFLCRNPFMSVSRFVDTKGNIISFISTHLKEKKIIEQFTIDFWEVLVFKRNLWLWCALMQQYFWIRSFVCKISYTWIIDIWLVLLRYHSNTYIYSFNFNLMKHFHKTINSLWIYEKILCEQYYQFWLNAQRGLRGYQ